MRLAVCGATGRSGARVVALAGGDVAAALASPNSARLGQDAGEVASVGRLGVPVTATLPDGPLDAVIDFSSPAGTRAVMPVCVTRHVPLVIATTGFDAAGLDAIRDASERIPILHAANTSLVVTVLLELTRQAAALLNGRDFDVEILERHHRFKKDAPSGTALALAAAVQAAQGEKPLRHGREGFTDTRPPAEIGVHAIRHGDTVGEHTVVFGALGETLELHQRAHTRDAYAAGALAAARFLVGKPPGLYAMRDVLGV